MNSLFELVTITPEFDFNQLEDEEKYTCLLKAGTPITIQGYHFKQYPDANKDVKSIYLPHTEEKKVSEEAMDIIHSLRTGYIDLIEFSR